MTSDRTDAARNVLEMRHITKRFGENTALDDVSLTLAGGSIRALIGMNGSGKSTLVKILAGYHAPDAGDVTTDGERAGISFVHQDLALLGDLTVIENLSLGNSVPMKRGMINRRAERERAAETLRRFGLEHVVDRRADELTRSEATIVAIARALEEEEAISVLVLDEPTSSLPSSETARLLEVMRECASRGIGVLFISHRLSEVLRVADEVTVLRNGVVVYDGPTSENTVGSLARRMAGDLLDVDEASDTGSLERDASASVIGEPAIECVDLTAGPLRGVDLTVRTGEVVGIAGLLGSGIEEIGLYLSGRKRADRGRIRLQGVDVAAKDARRIGYVPAHRAENAAFAGMTARENASVTTLDDYVRRGVLSPSTERRVMSEYFHAMSVYPVETEGIMSGLSGGNQQKVIFVRWLSVDSPLLVAEEPTQGVDVHAKAQILASLRDAARQGLAVILISGEPDEIAHACDRVIVLNAGRVTAEVAAPVPVERVLAEMHKEAA